MRKPFLLLVFTCCAVACTAVDGDRIVGSDLARADARFAVIGRDATIGFSPVPGSQRIFDISVLVDFARRYGIPEQGFKPLCFERATEQLTEATLRPILERALGAGTKLEIVEFSRFPVPNGQVEFSAADLPHPTVSTADAVVVWRGRVRYGERSTVSVWAKVRILRLETWLEAVCPIPARTKIGPAQIATKSGWRFPFSALPLSDPSAAVGKAALRSIAPGQVIMPALLTTADEVERGDAVDVEVASGGVRLKFAGRADTSGHPGEVIVVTAAGNGRRYRARIQEKGKVVINVDVTSKPAAAGGDRDSAVAVSGSRTSQTQEDQQVRAAVGARPVSR